MDFSLDPAILQQIQSILRRDLKLAPDEPLPPEMPFFGGAIDLDSLDMLLVLTSIERQFGVKIADHELGKRVFQSVGALADYVQNHCATAAPPTQGAQSDQIDWLSRLPHGPAFRFITQVLDVQPGQTARGFWKLDGSEPFFAAHFPGQPIVPGILIAEALAQISGFAGPANSPKHGMLAQIDLKFEAPAAPPVEIQLSSRLSSAAGALQRFEVVAAAGGRTLASGSITLFRPAGESL